ncbi:MAG TPA: serine/threonine-protein kinase [Xanthomonadaceae bacterium]|jgi:serine/threonine protein kinase|nr:serine/threonine-protein kinase [Xanthomonadaceae bacterium]
MSDRLDTLRWQRLETLFDRAVGLDPAEQAELIRTTAQDDAGLAKALSSLLAADARHHARATERSDGVLQRSLAAIQAPCAAAGDRVGPYILREELGQGGMGVVFRAERADGQVQQQVALKIVRSGLLDASGRERFLREREIVSAFQHPYIAHMLDVGETVDGLPFLAMELIRGVPITTYCDAHRLDTRARIGLFLRVCEAVQHAHANLVLHRDLKPSNVLVGADGCPKLIDFGIAKPLSGVGDEEHRQTATGHRFFSPSNAAPEQLRGERVGVACDVYQLGTLLYELLCGATVFYVAGLTPGQLERRILEVVPDAPSARVAQSNEEAAQEHGAPTASAWARELHGDLDAIVFHALRKPPPERYGSVEQLADDLCRYLNGEPVVAVRGQRLYRARKFLRRHALAVGLSMAALALVAAFVTALTMQSQRIAHERDLAVAERQRAEEATRFLIGVFKAADPNVSLSRDTPIGEVLANGSRSLDTELSGQPRLVSDLAFALAAIYTDLDDLSDARTYANRALLLRTSLDPGSMAQAESLGQLAVIEARAGNCKGALADGTRALDLFRRLGAGVSKTIDAQAQMIGCEAKDQGAALAIARMQTLLDALIRDPDSNARQIAAFELALAAYRDEAGDAKAAGRLRQSAVDRLQRSPWKDSVEALNAQASLAASLSRDGKFEQARAFFDRLLPQYERLYGRNSLNRAELLLDRGSNSARSGRSGEAEADLHDAGKALREQEILATSLSMDRKSDRAGAIFDRLTHDYERLYGRNSLDYADLLSERGNCLVDRGRFREAETDMLEARRIRNSLEQGPHIDQARAALDLANLYEAGFRDMTRAGAFHDEAVRIATATLGTDDLDTLRLKTARAVWLERVGRTQEAGDELRVLQEQLARRDQVGIDVQLAFATAEAISGKRPDAAVRIAEIRAAIAAHPAFADYTRSYAHQVHASMSRSYTNDAYNLPTTPYLDEQVDQVWKALQDEWRVTSCHYDLTYTGESPRVARMIIGPPPTCSGDIYFYLVGLPAGYYLGPERGPMRQKGLFMLPQDDPAKTRTP